jgi:hypothetical protein
MKENASLSMNDNIKIITRLRGSDKYSKYSKLLKLSDNFNINISDLLENLSKTPSTNQNKSASISKLKDDLKYTMFTSGESSKIMLVSQKPIKGATINEALKVCDNLYEFHNSILNETSILEYDKIYNETNSLEQIFNEIINDNITQLFHKKNSCVFCFGPTSGGKTFLLFGENNDINNIKNNKNNKYHYINCNKENKKDKNEKMNKGLIKSSINKILNLIKINKQGNEISSNTKNKYELKISVYQIYFDKIFDLLSKDIKKINLVTNYDENKILNSNLVGLTDVEIRNIQDYEKVVKEIEINRKNLSRNLKVKNINKNSNLIVSLKLRKKIQNRVGNNIIDNYSADYFSQIDFIELISSEIGITDKYGDSNDLSFEYSLYENTKNTYDSMIDNIACANYGITPSKESTLTLSLKNTLKANSNIIFFNCVIPWEFPIDNSFKALKFTTWLRNQVINEGENFNGETNNLINKNIFNSINESNNSNNYHFQNNSHFINNYKNPILGENMNNNININNTFPIINNSNSQSYSINNEINEEEKEYNSNYIDEENNIKLMRNHSSKLLINKNMNKSYEFGKNRNNKSQLMDNNFQNKTSYININENITPKDKTMQSLEQTLKELEDKKLEIENKMYEDKYNINNMTNELKPNNSNNNFQFSPNNVMSPEVLLMKEQQDILRSDNIIMKEDINHLNELNQNLENEVAQNRDIISQLKSENEKLIEENSKLKTVLKDYDGNNYTKLYITGQNTKDEFLQKYFDEKYILINKLKELEKNCDILQKERTQYEIDYKVLSTKYNEIIKKYEKNNLELINIRQIHDNELYNIDNKINDLSKEVEKLQNENFELRREIETQRSNNNTIEKERDMFKEKYEEQKYENDLLNKKIFEVEKGYSEALKKNEYDRYFKKEKEENYRNKNETKAKIAQELQSKIQKYRRERLQNKNNED